MTDNNSVILEKRGPAFWITINRPEKRNALNGESNCRDQQRLPRSSRGQRRSGHRADGGG